jgi:hypothetical protein
MKMASPLGALAPRIYIRGSLITEFQFPVISKKFPVLPRREFGSKRLTYILENEVSARFGGQIRENSLYFPGYQGIWLERHVRCSLPPQPH